MLCSDFQKLLMFVVVGLVIILVEFIVGRSWFPEASCWDVLRVWLRCMMEFYYIHCVLFE
jgi:hypothetical protein